MEYHEIGERFKYDGVILEVVELGIKMIVRFAIFLIKNATCQNCHVAQVQG